jgi:hypothetical protein
MASAFVLAKHVRLAAVCCGQWLALIVQGVDGVDWLL